MSYDALGPRPLDYLPCRYGTSKLLFRGPRRSLKKPYVAFLGGTETYGKYIADPFTTLVEQKIGTTCVNLGCVNAGIDVFSKDMQIAEMANDADVTVVQVMGAHNMSNRFYSVHPRRNDRFLQASPLLQTIFRDVDFSEFSFNKHMLMRLMALSPERFQNVVEELREAWLGRMGGLLRGIKGKTVLLWLADHAPDDEQFTEQEREPWFVTRAMVEQLLPEVTGYVQVAASESALSMGTEGMVFNEMDAPAAGRSLGPAAHQEAAVAIAAKLREIM